MNVRQQALRGLMVSVGFLLSCGLFSEIAFLIVESVVCFSEWVLVLHRLLLIGGIVWIVTRGRKGFVWSSGGKISRIGYLVVLMMWLGVELIPNLVNSQYFLGSDDDYWMISDQVNQMERGYNGTLGESKSSNFQGGEVSLLEKTLLHSRFEIRLFFRIVETLIFYASVGEQFKPLESIGMVWCGWTLSSWMYYLAIDSSLWHFRNQWFMMEYFDTISSEEFYGTLGFNGHPPILLRSIAIDYGEFIWPFLRNNILNAYGIVLLFWILKNKAY